MARMVAIPALLLAVVRRKCHSVGARVSSRTGNLPKRLASLDWWFIKWAIVWALVYFCASYAIEYFAGGTAQFCAMLMIWLVMFTNWVMSRAVAKQNEKERDEQIVQFLRAARLDEMYPSRIIPPHETD